MLDALNQIHLKDILLVFMGSAITILIVLYRGIQSYFEKYNLVTPLCGVWYTYHYSRANYLPVFRREKWEINRTFFGLKIKTFDAERPGLEYIGNVSFDSAHIIINLRGDKHQEILQFRLNQPIPNEDTMMLGFQCAKDFDHELYSAVKIICRVERSEDNAKDLLNSYFNCYQKEACCRLK